jgi:hypothetical protein
VIPTTIEKSVLVSSAFALDDARRQIDRTWPLV